MNQNTETIDQSALSRMEGKAGNPVPGLLLLFSAGEPLAGAIPLDDRIIEIGRGAIPGVELRDGRMSRRHARVGHQNGVWTVEDLASRNPTVVDGVALPSQGQVAGAHLRLVRTGDTLFLLCLDLRPYLGCATEVIDDCVVGAHMKQVCDSIARATTAGILHITGNTGVGKELAARAFHRLGPFRKGPFVAVNCAAIPEGVAERLLFGARKGAFSGATQDVDGYIQAADNGTLFLDEVADLDLGVQAKLLRVIETHEVLALGASRPRKVELQICSATHKDLRQSVTEKSFREDLYFRLARPAVALPRLRDRLEDIPFLIDRELRRINAKLTPHVSLIETCLLRPWPGNVRELLIEIRQAVATSLAEDELIVKGDCLSESAGSGFEPGEAQSVTTRPFPSDETIRQALQSCQNKVATAAKVLGIHRTQLRRWIEKNPCPKA
ncbi:MAG: sigma 54-interacting transcriptional regulator [Deltaproteobacteria bacterium]|nr:sigma 54-interacting transcriptional regulator [Deltaproteobacteria bacterium]